MLLICFYIQLYLEYSPFSIESMELEKACLHSHVSADLHQDGDCPVLQGTETGTGGGHPAPGGDDFLHLLAGGLARLSR